LSVHAFSPALPFAERPMVAFADRACREEPSGKKSVERRRSHGIIVYAKGEPVGSCQYGPREELPRIDNTRNYRGLAPEHGRINLWRITCFVVDRRHRRRGVATVALQAALESIKKMGGGLVEAYPLIDWEKLRHSELRRRGHAPAFGNMSTHGTVSMFRKKGFNAVAPFGFANIVMRKSV
jgi:GNAT superfamily N-acetyltransferase